MIYSSLNTLQIVFIVVSSLIVLAIIALAILIPVQRKKMKSNFNYVYYKKIYRLAMDKDYYLINNFLFRIDDSHVGKIDHILFGDKYIYIINDYFYNGDIVGKEKDSSIVLINKDGKKNYEDNPILANQKVLDKLCLVTGIDRSLMIGVCLINDGCRCSVETTSKNLYIIQVGSFKKLVKAIESRDIGDINKEQLASAVKAINKLNRRKRRNG